MKIFRRGRFSISFLYFDLWVGVYLNRTAKTIYLCPIPCLVFRLYYGFLPGRRGA